MERLKFLLFFSFSLLLIGCSDSDNDLVSLKGRSFKCTYESHDYAYCITFDSKSQGRWFNLHKVGDSYTFNEESVSDFSYEYDYPKLFVENHGETSMRSSQYEFLSPCVFSDGNYTWTEINIKDLISNGNQQGGNSGGSSDSYGKLSVSPSSMNIDAGSGSRSISVSSNTSWSVSINNSGNGVNGLRVSQSSGSGNGSVTVSYDAVITQYYQQQAVIIFNYTGAGGYNQSQTVSIFRKHLP